MVICIGWLPNESVRTRFINCSKNISKDKGFVQMFNDLSTNFARLPWYPRLWTPGHILKYCMKWYLFIHVPVKNMSIYLIKNNSPDFCIIPLLMWFEILDFHLCSKMYLIWQSSHLTQVTWLNVLWSNPFSMLWKTSESIVSISILIFLDKFN